MTFLNIEILGENCLESNCYGIRLFDKIESLFHCIRGYIYIYITLYKDVVTLRKYIKN